VASYLFLQSEQYSRMTSRKRKKSPQSSRLHTDPSGEREGKKKKDANERFSLVFFPRKKKNQTKNRPVSSSGTKKGHVTTHKRVLAKTRPLLLDVGKNLYQPQKLLLREKLFSPFLSFILSKGKTSPLLKKENTPLFWERGKRGTTIIEKGGGEKGAPGNPFPH